MRTGCILSSIAFVLFFGLIGLFVFPSLIIYALFYPFEKYPQDRFQYLSSVIYKLFFAMVPRLRLQLSSRAGLPQSAIYVSTHQSNLDYPILGYFIEKYLIMTTMNYKKIPFVSMVGDLIGIRYLKRGDLAQVAKVYDEFEEMLKNDRNVIFFAEGTRHSGAKLGRFKKGAFRLAFKFNKPIIPVVIEGTGAVLKKGDFCFSKIQLSALHVEVLEPIYPKDFETEDEMLKYTQQIMQAKKESLCAGF